MESLKICNFVRFVNFSLFCFIILSIDYHVELEVRHKAQFRILEPPNLFQCPFSKQAT